MRTLDEQIAQQRLDARETLARDWSQLRWHYWCRLSWRTHVSAPTANEHLERLIRDLHRSASPTIRVVAGFHGDDPQNPHAHALVHLSRRVRARFIHATEFASWLAGWWYHGDLWAEPFDPTRQEPEHGGAVTYLARNPGTVVWG